MRMLVSILLMLLLVACTEAGGSVAPPPTPTPPADRVGKYVAPNGSASNPGTKESPWSLAFALTNPAALTPGDTIWMRGGTYPGGVVSTLTGTPEKPLVLRALPGERVTIDGRFDVAGSHAVYWGFEVTYSDPKRTSAVPGSDPTDLDRERVVVFVRGPFNKLVNLIVHDLGDGIFGSSSTSEGLEIYGCLVYNNGWDAPDRGHGHNMYLQNRGPTIKRIVDNVAYNAFDIGVQMSGSEIAFTTHYLYEGNTFFGAGSPVEQRHGLVFELIQQGGAETGRATYNRNSFHHVSGNAFAVRFNTPGGSPHGTGLTFTNNIVQGQTAFNQWEGFTVTGNKFTTGASDLGPSDALVSLRMLAAMPFNTHAFGNNQFAVPASTQKPPFYVVRPEDGGHLLSLAQWRSLTGYDLTSTLVTGSFATPDVIVRPNQYEPGRAFVTVWNWQGAATVNVPMTGVLNAGDSYVVHHVYNVFGPPVTSGTYNGQPLAIRQTGHLAPTPHGHNVTPPSTSPTFNVFLVRKTN